MPLEAGCLAYAALANIALTWPRHRALAVRTVPPVYRFAAAGVFLALGLVFAITHLGGPQGVIAWFGLVSAAAMVLVLTLSRWPAVALRLWVGVAALGLALHFV